MRALVDRDVEVQDVFALAELGVESDGGRIDQVRLDIDDVGAALPCDQAQLVDECGRDTLATVGAR